MTSKLQERIRKIGEDILKEACIEAQSNDFISPIVFRQGIKLELAILSEFRKYIEEEIIGEDENSIVRPYGFNDSRLTNIDYRKSNRNDLREEQRKKLAGLEPKKD